MGRKRIEASADDIVLVLYQYIHSQRDRKVMIAYLTDYPDSLEQLAEMCELSVSTVKRIINRNSFVYKHFD